METAQAITPRCRKWRVLLDRFMAEATLDSKIMSQPLSPYPGIIHSDIGDNVLFHEEIDPCGIDFSPAFGSVGYTRFQVIIGLVS